MFATSGLRLVKDKGLEMVTVGPETLADPEFGIAVKREPNKKKIANLRMVVRFIPRMLTVEGLQNSNSRL